MGLIFAWSKPVRLSSYLMFVFAPSEAFRLILRQEYTICFSPFTIRVTRWFLIVDIWSNFLSMQSQKNTKYSFILPHTRPCCPSINTQYVETGIYEYGHGCRGYLVRFGDTGLSEKKFYEIKCGEWLRYKPKETFKRFLIGFIFSQRFPYDHRS